MPGTARLALALALPVLLAGVAAVVLPRSAYAQPDAERGREVYAQQCAMCHGAAGEGMGGMHPALGGVIDRLTREGVEVTIRNGRDTRPPMPAFADRLTEEEIADVITHLETLPAGPRRFGPEMADGNGMGGMMDRMWGDGGTTALWAVVVVLAALAAFLAGLLAGQRRERR